MSTSKIPQETLVELGCTCRQSMRLAELVPHQALIVSGVAWLQQLTNCQV